MHTKRKRRTGPRYADQSESPFLSLPGEIRTRIYEHALLKNGPIDLCPSLVRDGPRPVRKDMAEFGLSRRPDRMELLSSHDWQLSSRRRREMWGVKRHEMVVNTRYQKDLEYVRKEMCVGLLGTCRQVYDEAAIIFWGENSWEFTSGYDSAWKILFRWLLTICHGPSKKFIRNLGVHLPSATQLMADVRPLVIPGHFRFLEGHEPPGGLDENSKNYPKLHMAKVADYGWRHNNWTDRACRLMVEHLNLDALYFVLPSGWQTFEFGRHLDTITGWNCMTRSIRLVIRQGAFLNEENVEEVIDDLGWTLIMDPGSKRLIWEKSFDFGLKREERTVTEHYLYQAKAEKNEYSGIQDMFDPIDMWLEGDVYSFRGRPEYGPD